MSANAPQGSPLWWLDKLSGQLDARQPGLQKLADYYDGKHPLAFATSKFRDNFGRLFEGFADNWMPLVVDAVEERLNVEGFRLGADHPEGDTEAWDIWQANQMDADSQLAHIDALLYGEAFAMVWSDGAGGVQITVESARQTIVAMQPGSQRDRAAALKKWVEDDGTVMATVYLPDAIFKYQSARPVPQAGIGIADASSTGSRLWTPLVVSSSTISWEERRVRGETWPLPNPLGVVPVVPLVNRPRMLKPGVSEIAQAIPIQDAVNKTITDMLVASEFAGYRQRWATGIEIPIDPETKKPVEPFKHAVDRLWLANPTVDDRGQQIGEPKFGEFGVTELSNYVGAIEMFVQHIASQTRTPPHYFYLKGQMPSGESIKSAETGLVAKARRKMRFFEEGWEEVIRLAFGVLDDPRSKVTNSQTIWKDPESRTESEHMDATVKLLALEVPVEALWERAGFTPQEIERFKAMRAAETPQEQAAGEPSAVTETINIRA